MHARRLLRLAATVPALVLLGGASTEKEQRPIEVEMPFASADPCTSECASIINPCDFGYHYAWNAGSEGNHSSGLPHPGQAPEACREDTCTEKHPLDCGDEEEEETLNPEDARLAIAEENAADLLAMAESHPKRVEINADRQAVQFIDCRGDVVAHLPISRTMLRSLTAKTQ